MNRSRAVAVALVMAVVGPAGSAPAGQSKSTPARPVASTIGLLRICSHDVAVTRRFAGYRYVILNAWNYGLIPGLKKQTPGVKVLVYKDMSTTRSNSVKDGVDNHLLPAGVGYAYASKYHPEWFLLDSTGARINWSDWPWQWQMDVGNPAYQHAWLANVSADLKRYGWDGVMIDNADASLQYPWILDGRTMPRYPADADYEAATTSFLEQVAPALKKRGFMVIANMNDAAEPLWERWISLTSGAMKEWWTKNGLSPGEGFLGGRDWGHQQKLFRLAQSKNRIFLPVALAQAPDPRAMRYARASFLLGWNGGASAIIYQICDADPWSADWAVDVGAPAGKAHLIGGVWRRAFARGIVLVNPSDSAVPVRLPSAYLASDRSRVTSVVVGPRDGLVLRLPPR